MTLTLVVSTTLVFGSSMSLVQKFLLKPNSQPDSNKEVSQEDKSEYLSEEKINNPEENDKLNYLKP